MAASESEVKPELWVFLIIPVSIWWKQLDFLMLLGGIERGQWHEMGQWFEKLSSSITSGWPFLLISESRPSPHFPPCHFLNPGSTSMENILEELLVILFLHTKTRSKARKVRLRPAIKFPCRKRRKQEKMENDHPQPSRLPVAVRLFL